jgi:hypothetical protein
MRTPLIELIPVEVRVAIAGRLAVESGLGAGPSYVMRKDQRWDPSVPLDEALAWLEPYRSMLKKCHVELDDGSTLFFYPDSFIRLAPPRNEPEGRAT